MMLKSSPPIQTYRLGGRTLASIIRIGK
uniref:Uncharacterized protein n=1 Tax=Rhizophora mucronata TaxID=61149 RepID=A0A2P2N8C2_RHIMU